MKEVKIYGGAFALSGDNSDPRKLDYKSKRHGLHRKNIFKDDDTAGDNAAGDLVGVEYYKSYDSGTDTYSDLVVKEDRVYTRDADSVLSTRVITTKYYQADFTTVGYTHTATKHYSAGRGIEGNERTRKNQAAFSMEELYEDLVVEYSAATATPKFRTIKAELAAVIENEYTKGDKAALDALIDASVNTDLTAARKTQFKTRAGYGI